MNWPDYLIKKVDFKHKNYPKILKEIKNSPKTLFFRGNLDQKVFRKSLSVVGTRRITHYGKMAVNKLISELVPQKVTIISGFMYGVDSEAHQRCLEYGGTTVAVLGSGLNVVYPPENHKLYQQILESGGAIISEYHPETKPQLWTFPQRNRIVAGLASLGVLIIEAGERSGSLITARLAREQGKKIFVVPGPITSSVSTGTNLLIKNHQAKMVLSSEDILGKKIITPSLFASSQISSIEKKIFKALQREPLTVDELAQVIGKNIIEAGKALTMMSLKGFVTESVGKYYLVPNASSLS